MLEKDKVFPLQTSVQIKTSAKPWNLGPLLRLTALVG
jgi:hypothetical protein